MSPRHDAGLRAFRFDPYQFGAQKRGLSLANAGARDRLIRLVSKVLTRGISQP